MKYVKMLSLMAVAVLAVMAFVGVSSAAAKGKVCSTTGTGGACAGAHGKEYTGPIKATLIATTGSAEKHAVLTSGFVQVTCTESAVEGEVTSAGTATGFITKLTFSGCSNNINGGPCTATTSASSSNKWHATGTTGSGGNGTMDVSGVTGSFTCNIFFANRTCNYKAASASVDVFGSDSAPTIEATGVPLELEEPSDGFCSSTAVWEGRYQVTTPATLFIT